MKESRIDTFIYGLVQIKKSGQVKEIVVDRDLFYFLESKFIGQEYRAIGFIYGNEKGKMIEIMGVSVRCYL